MARDVENNASSGGTKEVEGGRLGSEMPKQWGKSEEEGLTKKILEGNYQEAVVALKEIKEELNRAVGKLEKRLGDKLFVKAKGRQEAEEWFKKVEDKIKEINSSSDSDWKKYQQLQKLNDEASRELENKITQLREESSEKDKDLTKEAKAIKNKKLKEEVQKITRKITSIRKKVAEVNDKQKILEKLKREFDNASDNKKEKFSGKIESELNRLINNRQQVVGEVFGVVDDINKLEIKDYEGFKGYRDLIAEYHSKLSNAIKETNLKLEEIKSFLDLEDKLKLFEARASTEQITKIVTPGQLSGLEKEVKDLKGETEKRKMLNRLERIKEDLEGKKKTEKVWGENLTEKEKKDLMELLGGISEEGKESLDKLSAEAERLIKKGETDSEKISDSVEIMKALNRGQLREFQGAYESWRRQKESPFRPERMLQDAKREIVKRAIDRLIIDPEGDKKVTREDVESWVKENLSRVISGDEESTGYTARQFLGEISGIMEAKDLHFDDLDDYDMSELRSQVEGMVRRRKENGEDSNSAELGSLEKLLLNFEKGMKTFLKESHIDRVEDIFRATIGSAIVVNEIRNAYNRTSGPEDMIRIMAATKTEHAGLTLKMKSVKKNIAGRLLFYEVDIDKVTGKRKVRSIKDFNGMEKKEYERLHTGEFDVGGVDIEITDASGRFIETIRSDKFTEFLQVKKKDLTMNVGDVVDIMNQARFANGVLNRRFGTVSDKFDKEVIREAIAKNMGVVDIDGKINMGKIEELIKEYGKKHGKDYDSGVGFRFRSTIGEKELITNMKKVRLKMIMEEIGGKTVDYENNPQVIGGIQEKARSVDDMKNEFNMMFKLGKGIWNFTGSSVGHWNKNLDGECKDWHGKTIHYVRYVNKFGIGPAHLRQIVGTHYHDFITQREREMLPEFSMDGHINEKFDKKGKEKIGECKGDEKHERMLLSQWLTKDRQGFVMCRQKMLEMLGRYRELEDKDKGKGNKFLKKILAEKAQNWWGDVRGLEILDRHWHDISHLDWSKSLENAIGKKVFDKEFGSNGKTTQGFEGMYWFVKEHYKFSELNWGIGEKPGDKTWSQRLFKEAKYCTTADKFKTAWTIWLADPSNVNKLIEALNAPGYYGYPEKNWKSRQVIKKFREYFSPYFGETVKVDPHSNGVDTEDPDSWDGTCNFEKTQSNGACLSKLERGLGPYSKGQIAEVINQFQRSGMMLSRYVNEIRSEILELGNIEQKINYYVADKAPPVFKEGIKTINFMLFGGRIGILGQINKEWENVRFPGLAGWFWKWLSTLINDVWQNRGDIFKGTVKEVGKQAGETWKEGFK